ncbi:hypothetical protein B0H14DRAFT_2602171 [Mycena olivaceomarginata]|nr:hypothetical protein B0H14DRAFT_2602171 [Mycena olivaceomarginata]
MQDIAILSANLATLVLQSFLYGFLVLLFIVTIYFLATRRTLAGTSHKIRHNFTSLVFLGVTALFLAITAKKYWSIVIYQAFFVFIHLGPSATEAGFYANIEQPTEIAKMLITFLSVLLGDSLVTYRLWIIWGRTRNVVIFPIFALIGFGVTFAGVLVEVIKLRGALFAKESIPWEATGYVLSLFLWLIFTMMTLLFKSDLFFIAQENLSVILGISNTLIHARVGLGWSQDSVLAYKSPINKTCTRRDKEGLLYLQDVIYTPPRQEYDESHPKAPSYPVVKAASRLLKIDLQRAQRWAEVSLQGENSANNVPDVAATEPAYFQLAT